jgi:hypothetical protein
MTASAARRARQTGSTRRWNSTLLHPKVPPRRRSTRTIGSVPAPAIRRHGAPRAGPRTPPATPASQPLPRASHRASPTFARVRAPAVVAGSQVAVHSNGGRGICSSRSSAVRSIPCAASRCLRRCAAVPVLSRFAGRVSGRTQSSPGQFAPNFRCGSPRACCSAVERAPRCWVHTAQNGIDRVATRFIAISGVPDGKPQVGGNRTMLLAFSI